MDRSVFAALGVCVCLNGVCCAQSAGRVRPDGSARAAAVRDHACLGDAQRALAQVSAAANRERFASTAALDRGAGLTRYVLFPPQGGRFNRDVFAGLYVDVDPTPGAARAYECSSRAYDGHNGVDIDIKTFSEMGPDDSPIGMPIFAAADGVVLFVDDGHPDRNENCDSFDTNFVILGHADGQESWYFHMKRGSVSVGLGEQVVAGQQIGLVGSSGCSYGPHLHFETRVDEVVREAFRGDCHDLPSLFANQPALDRTLYVRDGAVTRTDIGPYYPPDALPVGGVIDRSTDDRAFLWLLEQNVPAETTWTMRVRGPGGDVVFESGPWSFGNPEEIAWYFDGYFVDVGLLGEQNGEFRFQIDLGGQQVIDAPFTVMASGVPGNRPPNAITSASIAPGAPEAGEVIVCDITLPLVNDDPDFDVLTFEYVWTVDDVEVRRVTSTGHRDVLARDVASAGQVVRCAVTASDGEFTTPSVQAQATVLTPCPADTNGDRVVNFADLNATLSEFGRTSGVGGLSSDINLDGIVNFADLNAILSAFGDVCE